MFSYAQFAKESRDRMAELIEIYSGASQIPGNGYGRHFEFASNGEPLVTNYLSRIKRNMQSLFSSNTPNYRACRC